MLRRQDVRVRLLPLIDSCVVSCFYNMILPTRVGGDVARILDLRGANNSLAKSASSVLVERLFGISILFIFAVVAALLRLPLARSEEHTSELQSLMRISYDVFCLKKKKTQKI